MGSLHLEEVRTNEQDGVPEFTVRRWEYEFILPQHATSKEAENGTYLGDNVPCLPNPCPEPEGACCTVDAAGNARLVADVDPNGSSNPEELAVAGPRLFFAANDGSSGIELWVTDGSAAGKIGRASCRERV